MSTSRTSLPWDELPLSLPVAGRLVVVVGAGPRAAAAATTALDHGAVVRVISGTTERPTASLTDLADRGRIDLVVHRYRRRHLSGMWLVFPRTGDAELDERIMTDAVRARVWCAPAPAEPVEGNTGGVGKVSIVGGGPGEPGLITVRGKQLLECADVVVHDRLAPLSLLSALPPSTALIDAAKVPGGVAMRQVEINRQLVQHARLGRHVVRLKGGDPFVFGRGMEEVEACVEAGVPVEVVPGVSSAISVPALAGVSLTHRGLAHAFTVVSGHLAPESVGSHLDWAAMVASGATLVLMMAVETLPAITAALLRAGMDPHTPAVSIQDGASSRQRVIHSRLDRLVEDTVTVKPPAVTVVGPVAGRVTSFATAIHPGDFSFDVLRDAPAGSSAS